MPEHDSCLVLISVDKFEKECSKKPRGRFLSRPQSVGGDIQPLQVTVLTPATHRR